MLMQRGKGDAALLLRGAFQVWADYLAEEKDEKQVAQFQDHLKWLLLVLLLLLLPLLMLLLLLLLC